MKKIFVVVLLAAGAGLWNDANAQDYKTALGVRLSSSNAMQNNSVSFKHFITEKTAIEALFTFGTRLHWAPCWNFINHSRQQVSVIITGPVVISVL